MRTKYAAPFSYPDFSMSAPGRMGTDYAKTGIALTLRQLGAASLAEKYQVNAKTASAAQGCANCCGIEVLRSCIAARGFLAGQGITVDFDSLAMRYCPSLCGGAFGDSPESYYKAGLRFPGKDGGDEPLNPFVQRWYETLLASKARLAGDNRYLAVTKKSANAHSVIARKTLEVGFRYGLCEYLAAVPARGFRDVPDATHTMARWDELRAEFKDLYADPGVLTGAEWIELARRVMDSLATDLSGAIAGDELDWPEKKATLAGLCTLYRHLILTASARQRRLAPDVSDYINGAVTALSCANAEPNKFTGSFDVTNIANELGRMPAQGAGTAAQQLINTIGLKWQNEASVEFGHQCGICENCQGDDDLPRRLIDFLEQHAGRSAAHPSVGATFSDLTVSPEDDTVWDLANAVTCQAVGAFYANVCVELARAKEGTPEDFLTSLAYHCNSNAVLFVSYLEILMLELGYCNEAGNGKRVVKLLKAG
jgi:hypothetical protein